MSGLIEKHLEELCNQNLELKTLASQWDQDKKLISKALQSVSSLFAHYSLHDSSHSNQIVNQIERILGEERIKKLSATDCWLILESAYLHDIGMVVPESEKREAWESPQFKIFLKEIANNPEHSLSNYAKTLLLNKDSENLFSKSNWQLDIWKSVTVILAEYFRKKHPEKARMIAENPSIISLNSSRSELLPSRFFKTLGIICEAHGKSFDDVMKIEDCISGLSTEKGHPRFVACLLRLGDLLDLDNNRFCPVLLKTFGEVPEDTKSHKNKHASIIHFRVDTEKIEVIAECTDDDTYFVTDQWFRWLKEEIKDQMSKWSEIVPSKEFGLLPNISKIEIIYKKYITLEENIRPKMQIDTKKALDLFQGHNIYDSEYVFIREAIQNAIDSSSIALWKDIKEGNISLPETLKDKINNNFSLLEPNDFREIYKNYPIKINLKRLSIDENTKKVKWSFEIEDRGIGITTGDLKYISNIGSSSKNKDKMELIEDMPEWLKPSGIFGIGLQSYFLVTDKIKFETKSKINYEALTIEILNPNKRGNILIERKKSHELNFGTKLSFEMEFDNIPIKNIGTINKHTKGFISNYDPIKDKYMDYSIGKILDDVNSFFYHCMFPLEVDYDIDSERINNYISDEYIYEPKTCMELKLDFTLDSYNMRLLYRNSVVSKNRLLGFDLCDVTCNLLKGKSDGYLTLNRDDILPDKSNDLKSDILSSIKLIIPQYYRFLTTNSKMFDELKELRKQALSLFIKINDCENIYKDLDNELKEYWKKIVLDDIQVCLGDLVNKNYIRLKLEHTYNKHNINQRLYISQENNIYQININLYNGLGCAIDKLINKEFYPSNVILCENDTDTDYKIYYLKYNYIYEFSKENLLPDKEIVASIVYKIISDYKSNDIIKARFTVPLIKRFEELEIKNMYKKITVSNNIFQHFMRRMILPYCLEQNKLVLKNFDELIDFTHKNTENKSLTKNQIRDKYNELIELINEEMKDNADWKALTNTNN